MRKFLLISIVLVVSALGVAQAAEYYTKDKDNKTRLEPTEEMAAVYVFRPAMIGAAVKTWSFYGDELIGVSKAKAYSAALVPEGKHIFWSKAENTSAVEVEVKPGRTYYFKQTIKPGLGKARVKMIVVDEAEANKYFKKCGYAEPTEAGRAQAVEIAANRLERAEAKIKND